jgi:hypothetical protein
VSAAAVRRADVTALAAEVAKLADTVQTLTLTTDAVSALLDAGRSAGLDDARAALGLQPRRRDSSPRPTTGRSRHLRLVPGGAS